MLRTTSHLLLALVATTLILPTAHAGEIVTRHTGTAVGRAEPGRFASAVHRRKEALR